MNRLTIIGFCLAALAFNSYGQKTGFPAKDTVELEGFISADKTLSPNKVYHVKYNVKVGKGAVLTVAAGTQVVFESGTSIVMEGGLNVQGAPNNFAEFTSLDPNSPGSGILIRGNQGKDIDIRYAVFRQLSVPLRFEAEWSRKNVAIEKNVFTELYTGESNILITSPVIDYQQGADNTVNFSFSSNAFYDNWGSIFIENFEDNFMKLKFDNNLITNNVVYGIDIGIPSNTPVFGLFDDQQSDYKMQMEGNSIFGNYQINSSTDTIIREISVGIQGDGEQFGIPNNFFRSKNSDYISSTFDHFYQNSELPLLKSQPILTEPKEVAPPHIWKVKMNSAEVVNYDEMPGNIDPRNVSFDVYFNKPVTLFDKTQLEMVTYDTIAEKITKKPIVISQGKWSGDRQVFSFVVSNASFVRDRFAYIILTNFKDGEGFIAPDFPIGQRKAINQYRRISSAYGVVKTADLIGGKGQINIDVTGKAYLPTEQSVKAIERLTDLEGLKNLQPYRSLTKTWELGLMAGVSNYLGTLTYGLVSRDDFHFSLGIYGQYNLNKWVSFRGMFWYGRISGNDYNSNDPDRFIRLMNFKNTIVEGSLTAHWHLLKYGTSRGEKFTPTIFAGVGIFRNNPMSKIFLYENDNRESVYLTYKSGVFLVDGSGDEVWVPLRPIGTEGQTVGGIDPEAFSNSPSADLYADRYAPKQFKKVSVSFPVGISLDYIIYNKWIISAELGMRLTTTKYLDGVGGYYWDRGSTMNGTNLQLDQYGIPFEAHQTIINANPEIWGKVGNEKVLLDNKIKLGDPNNGVYSEYYTAALLANPSLINVDQGIANHDPNRPNPNTDYNDAFTFNHGKRANPKALDHYAFFGLRVSKVFGKRDKKSNYKSKTAVKVKDNDNDFLSDADEKLKGTNPRNPDTDGDGLIDGEEVKLGTDPLKVDTDEDGLNDYKEVQDLSTDATKKDSDNDGLEDGAEVNLHKTDPMNPDTDKGGINDGDEVNKFKTNPLNENDDPADSDNDGVYNRKDDCPNQSGEARHNGCPDSDGDGLIDNKDDCPNVAGVMENGGCPKVEPKVEPDVEAMEEEKKEVEEDLQKLFRNIEFDTNKDVIRAVSYDDLTTASEILEKHTQYNVIIEGHTDDVGNDVANKTLSQKRADAVKRYLVNNGIKSSRIVATGYGEERPIASNDTEADRQKNRRVEIKLYKPY